MQADNKQRVRRIAMGIAVVIVGIMMGIPREVTQGTLLHPTQQELPVLTVCKEGPPVCQFAKIQDAIDAAPEGTIIVIKAGTYEENLIVRKSLTLQAAEGEQVVVKSATDSLPTLLLVNGRPIHVGVMGLTLQPARQHHGNGIEVMGMVAARIERNTIQDYEWGILVLGKIGQEGLSELPLVISENTVHSAIWIRGSATVDVSKNTIQRNEALSGHSPQLVGIAIEDSGDIAVSENLIEEGSGVWISQSYVKIMTRNIIRKNLGGITIKGSTVSVSDNQIEQNGWWGVGVISSPRGLVWLTGNRITQQEYYGLVVEELEYRGVSGRLEYIVECQGNQIRDNKQGDYRVQSPIISVFGEPRRDPVAEEKLRQQCEGD